MLAAALNQMEHFGRADSYSVDVKNFFTAKCVYAVRAPFFFCLIIISKTGFSDCCRPFILLAKGMRVTITLMIENNNNFADG